jgi:putative ABC transport system permease protein
MTDFRYAIRSLLKRPGFAVTSTLVLGLGIGLNSVLFSVVDQVLLSPLPFPEPSELMIVHSVNNELDVQVEIGFGPASGPDYLDWKKRSRSFVSLTACEFDHRVNLSGGGTPVALSGAKVTPDFFGVFRAPVALGSPFSHAQIEAGNDKLLVLSHGTWQRQFGGDPNIIGKLLRLDGESYEVVGVMSRSLGFLEELVEFYLPLPERALADDRMSRYLLVFGRLRPSITPLEATTELNTIAAALAQAYPEQKGWTVRLENLQEGLVQAVRPAFWILHAAVGVVLLIACVNIANLLLVRDQGRVRELAVRASLGATRRHLVRQVLSESILLAVAGACLGLFLTYFGIDALLAISPKIQGRSIPFMAEVGLNGSVVGFTFGLALVAGLLMGCVPAWQTSRHIVVASLHESVRGAVSRLNRHRTLRFFVVAQVALSLVLLVGAGLLVRSYARMANVDPGFNPNRLLTLQMELTEQDYATQSDRVRFFEQLLQETETLPGVESVALINYLPMCQRQNNVAFEIKGAPPLPAGQYNVAEYRVVNADYFGTMGIPLRQGRWFGLGDDGSGLQVVVINERFCQQFFPEVDPIGKQFTVLGQTNLLQVVGVVGDVKFFGLGAENPPILYQPYQQDCWAMMSLAVKTSGRPQTLTDPVRKVIWNLDADQSISQLRPMEEWLWESTSIPRFATVLLSGFALVGLTLAAVGIYGVLAYIVGQRSCEIGVRMALGARATEVLRMVLRQGLELTVAGIVVGLLLSLALGRILERLLTDLSPHDLGTLASMSLVLVLVALLACLLPAWRAAKLNPVDALRSE